MFRERGWLTPTGYFPKREEYQGNYRQIRTFTFKIFTLELTMPKEEISQTLILTT